MLFTKFQLSNNNKYSKLELAQHYLRFSYIKCFKASNGLCGENFEEFFNYLDSDFFSYLESNLTTIKNTIQKTSFKHKMYYEKTYIINEFNKKLESIQIGEFLQEAVLYNYHLKYDRNIDFDLHAQISSFVDSYSNNIENKIIQTGGGLDKIINADITQNGYLLEFKKDLSCFETEISSLSKNFIFNINSYHSFFYLLLKTIKKDFPNILQSESSKKHINILIKN